MHFVSKFGLWPFRPFAGSPRARLSGVAVLASLVVLLACVVSAGAAPLTRAHSHNDYEHEHPLVDALSHGFWSVEADIWLTNGQLLVAHDFDKVQPEKTLQKLYLDPLQTYLGTNATLVKEAGPMTLLIDVKSDATNTWLALQSVLDHYTNMLTQFDRDAVHARALTVIISGNRASALLATNASRYAAIDGRLPDLDLNPSTALVPLVSDNWTKFFKWRGNGPLSSAEKDKLRAYVEKTHAQGRRIRLWATPDSPASWRVLLDAGVDFINTDHLAEFETFFRGL